MTPLDDLPAVLTAEEVARLLRIGRSACYELIRTGAIPSIKLGRAIRVPRHQLVEMLGLNEVGGREDAAHGAIADGVHTSGHRQQARNLHIEQHGS